MLHSSFLVDSMLHALYPHTLWRPSDKLINQYTYALIHPC
jgi:hypothetical protein